MLNKKIIESVIATHKKPMNWVILTNVAVGRGINGVSYERYFHSAPQVECNGICEFTLEEDCVIITQKCNSIDERHQQNNTIILPWENIVTIKFFPMNQKKYTTWFIA